MDRTESRWQFDWKQAEQYLFGRSTLIGIASVMLLA